MVRLRWFEVGRGQGHRNTWILFLIRLLPLQSWRKIYKQRTRVCKRSFYSYPELGHKLIAWPNEASLEKTPWLGLHAVPGLGPIAWPNEASLEKMPWLGLHAVPGLGRKNALAWAPCRPRTRTHCMTQWSIARKNALAWAPCCPRTGTHCMTQWSIDRKNALAWAPCRPRTRTQTVQILLPNLGLLTGSNGITWDLVRNVDSCNYPLTPLPLNPP